MNKLLWYKGIKYACIAAIAPTTYVAHKPIKRAVHHIVRRTPTPAPAPHFARYADTITTDSLPLCVGNMPDIDELIPSEGGGLYGGGGSGGGAGGSIWHGGGGSGGGGGHTSPGVPEASTWAMMGLGFGGVGLAIRKRRRV